MKSMCIKTNNQKSIDYLLDELSNIELDNIYYSLKKFKNYKNVIIHYTGNNNTAFFSEVSYILSDLVIDIYEEEIINNLILNEYFYFNPLERREIAKLTIENSYNIEESEISNPNFFDILFDIFYNYISNNRCLYLKGFITFRTKDYISALNTQLNKSVNEFLIQREYNEFISLLKMYVNTEEHKTNTVHLIYNNSHPLLLDENKNIIKIDKNMFNAKFLSDITFSSNDYALNTLLSLVPSKIFIHLVDNNIDEFITTLKLIFESRVIYCTDCSICNLYKNKNKRVNL